MSASDPNSKIDLLDAPDVSARKIKKANAPPKVVENNGLLAFVEHVLLPASSLLDGERLLKVEREGQEPLVYRDIETLKKDYTADLVSSLPPCPNKIKQSMLTVMNSSPPNWYDHYPYPHH